MNGFGGHTYKWVNEAGERFFVKYTFKTEQGIENLTAEQAANLKSVDGDYAQRDLYDNIAKGNFPEWKMFV